MRRLGESLEEYWIRLFDNMNAYGLTCVQIADILNTESGCTYSESTYRKKYKVFNHGRQYERKCSGSNLVLQQTRELEKAKIQLRDQRNEIRRMIASDAKKDFMFEEIKREIAHVPSIDFSGTRPSTDLKNGTHLVVLSDLHVGIDFNNKNGIYNTDVAIERMNNYASSAMDFAALTHPSRCVVCLCGDLVSGNIHDTLRRENKIDLLEQVRIAAEMICQFVASIAGSYEHVDVYGVGGNHSRITEKDDVLLTELLDNQVLWYMMERFRGASGITIFNDSEPYALTEFNIGNKTAVLVHGDFDSLDKKGIAKINDEIHKMADVIVCGHLHECAFYDMANVRVIRGGCLCGSGDNYTLRNRLVCAPSQVMAYFDKNDLLRAVMPVYFT